MRANDFTNKVYYTLIINGVAKVTKKDYLALERLAKDYKKAHPKDKIKIVHSQDLPEGLKSAIAKAALASTLAVTSPNVPNNVPNTDKSIEYIGQGKSFPSTVQVVVDKDGKRRKIYSENMDDDLRDKPIPDADPNQFDLNLDEGDVIQGPWGKKKSTGYVDDYVTNYNKFKANGALETKIGKKVEKEAEGVTSLYKNHEVSKSAKSYYWILRIVDGYSKTQAINMTLIKYPADRSLEETDSTGMGGGSAGIGGGSMVGGPETYEEEFGPFKRKGKFKRTMAMTY